MLAYHARGDLAGYFKFNQAIHLKIVKYSGNAVLYNIYRQLNGNVRRARYMANLSKERWDAAVREHDEILAALSARDVEAHQGAALGPSRAQARERARRAAGAPGGVNAPAFPVRVVAAKPGDSALAQRLRTRSRRRGAVRRRLARPLLDRRLDLPGRADRRGGAAQRGSGARRDRDRRRSRACRSCRAAPAARSAARRSARRWSSMTSKYLNQLIDVDAASAHRARAAGHGARRAEREAARRTACGFRWTSPPARRRRSAAWRATIPAARARSPTATWCTTCSPSMR